ncbi:MAG: hypothetical protein N4J56_007073 [Chroococcidiopsis sp. SAG 2025]|nr:hypothetical protein [Chroococcidiopsis sp. SAG 2025]
MEDDDEAMTSADREYFEKHPHVDYYYRKPFLNEVGYMSGMHPEKKAPYKIKVMKTDVPGVRIRTGIWR